MDDLQHHHVAYKLKVRSKAVTVKHWIPFQSLIIWPLSWAMYMHMLYKYAFANSVYNLYEAKVTCQLHRHVWFFYILLVIRKEILLNLQFPTWLTLENHCYDNIKFYMNVESQRNCCSTKACFWSFKSFL